MAVIASFAVLCLFFFRGDTQLSNNAARQVLAGAGTQVCPTGVLNVLLAGPAGAGKGTQAEFFKDQFCMC